MPGRNQSHSFQETEFRTRIVHLILSGNPEKALELLSEHYSVHTPEIRVGTVKRHRKVLGCYVEKEERIYVSKSDYLNSPHVILHEFYHHLRSSQINRDKQAEKKADSFASDYVEDFKRTYLASSIRRSRGDCSPRHT